MNVQTQRRGDIDVVTPVGRIDSATAATFERAVNEVFAAGSQRMLLDFSQIEYVSSAGLRYTLLAGKRMKTVPGGKLVLYGLATQVREIFEISGFTAIFTICADLDAALAACAGGEARPA